MKLHTLKPNKGAKHRVKRLGCGESSGHGKTSCKGNKGQKARSGGSVRPGFEGGQMPLHRRLPKKGFNNFDFKTKVSVVNLAQLEKGFEDGATVNEESLREKNLVNRKCDVVKILGQGQLSKKLTVAGCAVSASAKEKIEAAGGSVEG
ncbi:50S ribosomal protein L15 [Haloferula sargassicola]|uniref:Large ribosomal subunit protein uL15 n=1 Tax=Haloferula sargassicola TaxID=490096 RepID=A0ABP9ULG9_9BACT